MKLRYKRKDIYAIIGIPVDTKGGNWDTGYNKYKNDYFPFCNVGVPGRTGHDYGNKFIGDDLFWYAKSKTQINQPIIKELLNPEGYVYIFYRTDDKSPFVYSGTGIAKSYQETTPVQITWELSPENYETQFSKKDNDKIYEGALKNVKVNIYERNPAARNTCIETKGLTCAVCGFDFEKIYGELGKSFIHVHHIKPLNEIGERYEIDPIKDLVPVCPNCHAMLHKKRPALTVSKLEELISVSAHRSG